MKHPSLLFASALILAACSYSWGGSGGDGGAGHGGAGGEGGTKDGGAGGCACPTAPVCHDALCKSGSCVAEPSEVGVPCDVGDPGRCSGAGVCETCGDGQKGVLETGVDCGAVGGAAIDTAGCPPCGAGQGCDDDTDCESGVCAGLVCT